MKYEAEAKEFLKQAEGKVGILFHDDGDGVCSAALLLAYLKEKGADAVAMPGKLEDGFYREFAAKPFDSYIIVDMAADQHPNALASLKGRRAILIDHHPIHNDLNKIGIVHFNPRFEKPDAYVCASHCVYDLIGKPKEFEWLMRLGAVSDHEVEGTDEEGEASDTVNAVAAMKTFPALAKLAVFLSKCGNMKEFLDNAAYKKLKTAFEKEIETQIAKYECEVSGNVTFFEVKSRYGISGMLSTKLFDLYPKRTIILYRRRKNMWGVSGRSHKYDMAALMSKAAEGIGDAGGHPVAAGANVSDFKTFKKRLEELLKAS